MVKYRVWLAAMFLIGCICGIAIALLIIQPVVSHRPWRATRNFVLCPFPECNRYAVKRESTPAYPDCLLDGCCIHGRIYRERRKIYRDGEIWGKEQPFQGQHGTWQGLADEVYFAENTGEVAHDVVRCDFALSSAFLPLLDSTSPERVLLLRRVLSTWRDNAWRRVVISHDILPEFQRYEKLMGNSSPVDRIY